MKNKRKMNWKLLVEGLIYPFLSFSVLCGIGICLILDGITDPENLMIAWFYIIIGAVVTVILLWAVIDWSYEKVTD